MYTGGSSSKHQASDFSSSQNQASDFSSTLHQGSDFSSTLHHGSDFSSTLHQGSDFSSSQNQGSDFSSTLQHGSEQCQNHKDHKLDLFCEDHDVLICSMCRISSHKKCIEHVINIDDKVKTMQQTGDFTKLIQVINASKQEMTQKMQYFESNAESLQMAFEEQLNKIKILRKKFNETLDKLESDTIIQLNILLETLKAPLQDNIYKCIDALSRVKNIQDEIHNIDKNTDILKVILYRKCLEKSSEIESMKSRIVFNRIPSIQFIPDSLIERFSSLSSLGKFINPNEILKVTGNTTFNIKRWGNFSTCNISHICETATGELLILDEDNTEVKFLDENFKVVTHYKLPTKPRSICSIDSNVVAVALANSEVLFLRATKVGQLVLDRKMKLEHSCLSMAHHHGNLYIASSSALYHYTVDVGPVSKNLLRRERGKKGLKVFAISPDGTNLYVWFGTGLVTLSRDGKVKNKFDFCSADYSDPSGFQTLCNVHVTDSGQILLCSWSSNKILQIDSDGRQILAEVVTRKEGEEWPRSVYYSKNRAALIVGMFDSNDILVFKT